MERTKLDPISAAYYVVADNAANVNVIKGGNVIVLIEECEDSYECECSLAAWREALASVVGAV